MDKVFEGNGEEQILKAAQEWSGNLCLVRSLGESGDFLYSRTTECFIHRQRLWERRDVPKWPSAFIGQMTHVVVFGQQQPGHFLWRRVFRLFCQSTLASTRSLRRAACASLPRSLSRGRAGDS